jgi:hypothetical protein
VPLNPSLHDGISERMLEIMSGADNEVDVRDFPDDQLQWRIGMLLTGILLVKYSC